MSTKTKKILVFIATALIMLSFLSTAVLAAPVDPDNIISSMGNSSTDAPATLTDLGGKVLSILQIAGIIIGTIILVVLGLKYMMGSLEEKAEYKKTMIPYLVGAVIIFAAPSLAKGIFTLIGNLGTA